MPAKGKQRLHALHAEKGKALLFITNRNICEDPRLRVGRKISLDLSDNRPSVSVYFCERKEASRYTEVGSAAFLDRLRQSDRKQLLFYVHGFNNQPETDIFPRSASLQTLLDAQAQGEVLVVPIVWPCDSEGSLLDNYWDDQKSADASAFAFARALEKFMAWRDAQPESESCLKRMNVLAHSMGNRVLRDAIYRWAKYERSWRLPLLFRNIFMAAADVVNETLEAGEPGNLLTHTTKNLVVYYASDDLALRASKVGNLKNRVASRRLGHTGPEDMKRTPSNVYAVDCDSVNNAYDMPRGHAYFLTTDDGRTPGAVFLHMAEALATGRVRTEGSGVRTLVL